MLAADAARCALVTALVVLASQRLASLPLLAPVAALLGAGEGLFLPASFTIMPALLEPDQLTAGNALSSAMVQAGSLAGPVLGGLLVASARRRRSPSMPPPSPSRRSRWRCCGRPA